MSHHGHGFAWVPLISSRGILGPEHPGREFLKLTNGRSSPSRSPPGSARIIDSSISLEGSVTASLLRSMTFMGSPATVVGPHISIIIISTLLQSKDERW